MFPFLHTFAMALGFLMGFGGGSGFSHLSGGGISAPMDGGGTMPGGPAVPADGGGTMP